MSIITDKLSTNEEEFYKCPNCGETISFLWYGYESEQYCPICHKKV